MAQGAFDPDLHAVYGEVLLATEELFEAGKHFLLAGSNCEEHAEAIRLFVQRMRKATPAQIYSSFPRRARLSRLDQYPEMARGHLRDLRFPEEIPGCWMPRKDRRTASATQRGVTMTTGPVKLLIAVVLLAGAVGFVQIGRWIIAFGLGLVQ